VIASSSTPTVNSAPAFTTPVTETLETTVGKVFAYKLPDCIDPEGD
jgi:hypothetical protein